MSLIVPPTLYDQLTAHLSAAYPNEGAGLLLGEAHGDDRQVRAVLTFENQFAADEQYHRYLLTAEDMLRGEEQAEALGLDVLGVFHSHPDHPSVASEYDREYALPWYSYLIVSVRGGQPTTAQSWRLTDDRQRFDEEPVSIRD